VTSAPAIVSTASADVSAHLRSEVLRIPRRRQNRRAGMLNLWSNELIHPRVRQLVADALSGCDAAAAQFYPRHADLVDVLAAHLGVEAEQLLAFAGSDNAIKVVLEALAATSGVLVLQQPGYEQHYHTLYDLRTIAVDYRDRAFHVADFARALPERPCTVLLSNPNGPTGACLPLDEVAWLARRCADGGHLLVIDEAYVGYNGFDHVPLLAAFDNVLLIRSLSKSFGVAGLRVACVVGSPAVIDYLARWNGTNPLSGVSIAVVRYLVDHADELARVRREIVETRAWFSAAVAVARAWTPLPSAANFVNFETPSSAAAVQAAAALAERGILARPMTTVPPLARCVRFTIADRATMEGVLSALKEIP
jgi:histidinol-phosphate aminotransferase